jgi:formate dehydrogenase major subunit
MVHQVCLPWHFGTFTTNAQGVTGDAANDLVAISGDPNVTIHESKSFRCDVRAGRREEETTERLAGRRGHDEEPEAPDTAAQTDQSLFRYGGENREI